MNQPAEPSPQERPADESAAPDNTGQPVPGADAPAPDALAWAESVHDGSDSVPSATDDPAATLDGGEPGQDGGEPGRDGGGVARRGRRWPVVVSAVVVLVLLLSAAGYTGLRAWYGWGTTQPEQVIPADAAAFTRVDLSPGYRDKLRLAKLAGKFPAAKKGGATGVVDAIEKNVVDGSGLDFDRDVKPWFADRVGIALWVRDGKPVPVLALASTDDGKARSALAKVRVGGAPVGFALLDGYALVVEGSAGGQPAADAVASAARAHPLAKDPAYRSAVAKLRDDSLAYAYADLGKIGTAVQALIAKNPAFAAVQDGAIADPQQINAMLGSLHGTVTAGASVVDNGVEILTRGSGMAAVPAGAVQDVRAKLGALPAGSLIAVTTNGAQPDAAGTPDAVSALVGGLLTGILGIGMMGPAGMGPGDPADAGALGDAGITVDPDTGEVTLDPAAMAKLQAQIEAQFAALNEAMTKATTAVLTAQLLSLAVTGLDDRGPSGLLEVQTRGTDAATAITNLGTLLGDGTDGPKFEQTGDSVRVTMGDAPGSATLAGSALFASAVPSLPGVTSTAGFVDVTRLLATSHADDAQQRRWAPVKAVGFAMSRDGGDVTGIVRIVIQ